MNVLELLFASLIFPGFLYFVVMVILVSWLERKIIARIHSRVGPLYTGPSGVLQPLADFLKLLGKEKIVPRRADKFLFNFVPPLMAIMAAVPIFFIPLSDEVLVLKSEIDLLFVVVFLSFMPALIVAVAWESGNKFSLIGGIRAAASLLVYEIPLMLSIISVAASSETYSTLEIVRRQNAVWNCLSNPLGMVVFFLSALAELERLPFDIPTAEQEIVVGWETEFTGVNFAYVFFAKYAELIVLSSLFVDLFLGGWLGPFPSLANFLAKFFIVIFLLSAIRAAYSRLRMDQLLKLGWRVLIPLAVINIFIVKMEVSWP